MKLIYNFGVNDVDYEVKRYEKVDGKWKVVWTCPFYQKWCNMIQRCYTDYYIKNQPSYADCFVTEEWKLFSRFRAWMIEQDWEGKHLDKDLLFPGNKVYSPETCVFLEERVNLFLNERKSVRGQYKIGVSLRKDTGLFSASCSNPFTGKRVKLGCFTEENTAHKAWLDYKLQQAIELSKTQSDERVAKALIDRYENYLPS